MASACVLIALLVLLHVTAWVTPPPLKVAYRGWVVLGVTSREAGDAIAVDSFRKDSMSRAADDEGSRSQLASYNLRLMECARVGNVANADAVWRAMLQNDVTPDQASLELLLLTNLKVTSSNLQLDECEAIFSEIIKTHNCPSQKIVLALFRAFGRAKKLDRIERLYDRIAFLNPEALTIEVYNAIILSWARSDSEMATRKTQEWLDRLRFDGREPNVDTYSAIIDSWVGSGKSNAATEASNVLWAMRQEGMRPGPRQYESVLALWVGSRDPNATARMHALADEMKADGVALTQASYDSIITAYTQDTLDVPREAVPAAVQGVLVEMSQLGLDTTLAQTALVAAFVRSRLPGSAAKADAALVQMEITGLPPVELYTLVIDLYRRVGDPIKAEAVLDRFVAAHLEPASSTASGLSTRIATHTQQRQQQGREQDARSDTRPWVGVIRAYDRGSVRVTKPRARTASAASSSRHSADGASNRSTSSELAARSLDGPISHLEVFFSRGADDADRVFKKMLRCGVAPDLATYSTLIAIWAKLGEVDRVETLMADMSKRGVAPASTSYLSLLRCWLSRLAAAAEAEANTQVNAAAQVEAVFARMCHESTREVEYCQEGFQAVLRAGFSPSLETMKIFLRLFVAPVEEQRRAAPLAAAAASQAGISGRTELSSGARLMASLQLSSSPADSAVAVINKMVQAGVEPDIECYTLLIAAFEAAARTPRWSRPTIPDQALELVKSLLASRLTPSQEIYERLLRIWAKSRRSDAPRVADSIFRSSVGRLGSPPSYELFSLLMEAWAYSPLPNAAEKSEEVFDTMKAAGVAPTPRTFYLLARAWAKTSRRRGPFPVLRINNAVRRDNYLSRVEDVYRRCLEHGLRPSGKMAHTLVTVWALDGSPESIAQAESFLVSLSMAEVEGADVSAAEPSWREPHDAAVLALAGAWRDPLSAAANITARLEGQAARGQQLKLAYDLQLAAYGASTALAERHVQAALGLYEKMLHQGQGQDQDQDQLLKQECPRADILSLNLMLRCLRLTASRSVLERAHEILDSSQQSGIGPSDDTLAIMAAIWKDRGCTDALSRSQELFNRLVELRRPSHASYALLLELLSDSDPRKSTALLDQMLASGMVPLPGMFAGVMRVWASKERPEMCESVFEKMRAMNIRPDPATCRPLLSALASSSRIDSAERTSTVLQQILDSGTLMDTQMLESVLKAWAKSGSEVAPVKAEEALQLAQASGVVLTVYEYNLVLDVFGKSRRAHAAELTEELLAKMSSAADIKPDLCSYNSVIAAWGRSGHPEAEARARRIFDAAAAEGLQPDLITYSSLVSALSRSSDAEAPYRASALFDQMLAQRIVPDRISWTILISLWARSVLPEKEDKVSETFDRMLHTGCEPNAVTYTVMLKMWATSSSLQAGRKVVELFKHMQQTRVKLDTVGYSSLLSALSKSREENAPSKASDVFEQMLAAGVAADARSWTILISLWAKSRHPERERRVESYFERMLENGAVPNVVTYTVMLRMWTAQAGGTRLSTQQTKARGCIADIYDRLGQENVALDGHAFSVLLSALRVTFEPAMAVDKAEDLLLRMTQFGLFPDSLSWCSMLRADMNSCRAFERAQRLYRAWLQGCPVSRGAKQGQDEVLPAVLDVLASCPHDKVDVWPEARKVLADAQTFGMALSVDMLHSALAVVSGPSDALGSEVDALLATAQPTAVDEINQRTVTLVLRAIARGGADPIAAEARLSKTMEQLGVADPQSESLVVVMELWRQQQNVPVEVATENLVRLARRARGEAAEVDAVWLVLLSSLGSGASQAGAQWSRTSKCISEYLLILAGRPRLGPGSAGQERDAAQAKAVVQAVLEALREAYWAGHAPRAELAELLRITGSSLPAFRVTPAVDKERFLPMMAAVLEAPPEGAVAACENLGFVFSEQSSGRWRRKEKEKG